MTRPKALFSWSSGKDSAYAENREFRSSLARRVGSGGLPDEGWARFWRIGLEHFRCSRAPHFAHRINNGYGSTRPVFEAQEVP